MVRNLITLTLVAVATWGGTRSANSCEWCGSAQGALAYCVNQGAVHPPAAYQTPGEGDLLAAFHLQNNGWTPSSTSTIEPITHEPTVTWSVVPDGTILPRGIGEPSSNSDLVEFLDGIHHGGDSPGGADLTQRTWWGMMNQAFERWDQVSGINFVYEPNDDGARSFSSRGLPGIRGDHRIGGHYVDGDVRPSNLAYNYFPTISDMVIDTSEATIFGNASGNYIRFRNMLMHEIGHGLGLAHVESGDTSPDEGHQFGTFLMEPILSTVFEGPQFDDILGAHKLYGDVFEKGIGNDIAANATDIGVLNFQQSIVLGADGNDARVEMDDIDFVSIDRNSDTDFYQFTITQPRTVNLDLTPLGPTYLNGRQGGAAGGNQPTFIASEQNDLALTLVDSNGIAQLAFANSEGLGGSEQLTEISLDAPGTYYIRVTGSSLGTQMYSLGIVSVPEPATLVLLASLGGLGFAVRRCRKNQAMF